MAGSINTINEDRHPWRPSKLIDYLRAMAPAFGNGQLIVIICQRRTSCPPLENPKCPHLKTISVVISEHFIFFKKNSGSLLLLRHL